MSEGLPRPSDPIRSRSQLLALLTQACELEHGLACSYLYAAFSLKQGLGEGGLTWAQLQKVRLWAAQIYFVAAEEMLHLAQVWNLQAAIGGTPYYLRPNFPVPSDYYPLNVPVLLERFSLTALDRFIQYERPADVALPPESPIIGPGPAGFDTVGELYGWIASGFETIPEEQLFIGLPERQVGPDLVDFPNIVRVEDRDTALEAIALITEQGEGIQTDRDDSHFGMFRGIRHDYLRELADAERARTRFQPVRMSISNPIAAAVPAFEAEGANVLADPYTADVADAFDSNYGLMLRALQYVFDNSTSDISLIESLSQVALELMTTVIKPLGEGLTQLPAGAGYEDQTGGPGFALARHVPLPTEPATARSIVVEKLDELGARLAALGADERAPAQLRAAAENVGAVANRFRGAERIPGPAPTIPAYATAPDGRSVPLSTS